MTLCNCKNPAIAVPGYGYCCICSRPIKNKELVIIDHSGVHGMPKTNFNKRYIGLADSIKKIK